jgi:hypothetical protein
MELGLSMPELKQGPLQRRLSKMYSDTKKSYDTVTEPSKVDVTPELTSLHRKFRIQKDRLITWGLEWSDTSAAHPGDIDESLEREGLADVVGSVMSSIKEILVEAEQMRYPDPRDADPGKYSGDSKSSLPATETWRAADTARSEDLLQQLTTCIDNLYKLSTSRSHRQHVKRLRKQSNRSLTPHKRMPIEPAKAEGKLTRPPVPTTSRSSGGGLSLHIDRTSLVIEPESRPSAQPPPYEQVSTPSNSRALGWLKRQITSNNPWKQEGSRFINVPVFIEYAPYDPIYSTTGISPPTDRLEQLAELLNQPDGAACDPEQRVLNLLGYFEEPELNRFGLVFAFPEGLYAVSYSLGKSLDAVAPFTLLSVLNADAASNKPSVPHLEDRFRLAYLLAITILRLHTRNTFHKDVTSNNIVFFRTPQPKFHNIRDFRQPYLCSFDVFSESNVDIRSRGHIYRHPLDRSDSGNSKQSYRATFDMYGLGLVLLEIGLWMPVSSFWKPRYDLPMFKSRVEEIYAKKLGPKCGTLYMRAVESCLSAADREFAGPYGDKEFDSQWGLYCDVVKRLEQCCALDEGDPTEQAADPRTHPASNLPRALSAPLLFEPPTPVSINRPPLPTKAESSQVSLSATTTTEPTTPLVQAAETVSAPEKTGDSASKPRLKVFPVSISPAQLVKWHNEILTQLERIMAKTLKDPTETFTIDLVGLGDSPQSAKPTILVTCTNVGVVKDVLGRRFKFDKSVFSLRVRAGKLRRSLARPSRRKKSSGVRGRRRPRRSALDYDYEGDYPPVMNGCHQERPLCGASIGAYKDGQHNPPVSYGGVVLVDGEPYGMTVHHLLDYSGDEEEGDDDSYEDDDEGDDEGQTYDDGRGQDGLSWSNAKRAQGKPTANTSERFVAPSDDPYAEYLSDISGEELSPAEDEDYSYSESTSGDNDDEDDDAESVLSNTGDTPGVPKGQGHALKITQPAIDDVEPGYYPSREDEDEEHLESFGLGCIHASSGIRRWKRDSTTHEIDWALLKVDDGRLQPHNLVQGGRRYCRNGNATPARPLRQPVCRQLGFEQHEDLFPNKVAGVDELGGLEVHCVGRTSGLRNGVISPAMSSVRVKGRRTASRSWHVLGGFGGKALSPSAIPSVKFQTYYSAPSTNTYTYSPRGPRLC